MFTLGIETSCDETSCAVLSGKNKILSNVVSSSLLRHQPFGGVVPEIASRHCLEQIEIVYQKALKIAGISDKDLDLVAVTKGPGLIGSLFTGVAFAKAISYGLDIPLIDVNHLEAHLSANFIEHDEPDQYLGVLISGGHTSLYVCEAGNFELLGETIDDACGEAYDKVAKLMGLGYPGGPLIDRLAQEGDPKAFVFTRPKLKKEYDFSFSGIKTAVYYLIKKEEVSDLIFQKNLSASFQGAVVSWICTQILKAVKEKNIKKVFVGGGVSANSHLRKTLIQHASENQFEVFFPPIELTGDNAAMIARRGIDLYEKGLKADLNLGAKPNLKIKAKGC